MSDRDPPPGTTPDFEVVLWGYHRGQVQRCLADMAVRLEEALGQAVAVELLQAQLCEAQLEVDQLRRAAEERPSVANQVAAILEAAQELHDRAQREAEAIRAGARAGAGRGPVAAPAE
jgi:hypothetical protein